MQLSTLTPFELAFISIPWKWRRDVGEKSELNFVLFHMFINRIAFNFIGPKETR